MAFDTFVFDLDGTLLDTLPDLVVITNQALGELGFCLLYTSRCV